MDESRQGQDVKAQTGTYVYCLVAARRTPSLRRAAAGPVRLGPVRLLAVDPERWLVVADAPATHYGEAVINRRLSDLEWVSKAAVAHEAVVEGFMSATAVLPMKLFTIFTSDERALDHVRAEQRRIEALLARVSNQREWGVRVVLDRTRAMAAGRTSRPPARGGVGFLLRKKAQRDRAVELRERARETVGDLFDRLSARSRSAKRRSDADAPVSDGPLLLDAAFLVPFRRGRQFKALVRREARSMARQGYGVTLSGPWPPYSFVRD